MVESRAESLAQSGFTAIWIPPTYKGNSGVDHVGYAVYDMYDMYDFGEFHQKGAVRTKYGTREELQGAVTALQRAGIHVYLDVVHNHRIGGDAEQVVKATPHCDNDRHSKIGDTQDIRCHTHFSFPGRQKVHSPFEWHWWHFTVVDIDRNDPEFKAVFLFEGKSFDEKVDLEKGCFDYLMGCDVDVKHPEVQEEIKAWGRWYLDTVGFDGVRFDAVNTPTRDVTAKCIRLSFRAMDFSSTRSCDAAGMWHSATKSTTSIIPTASHGVVLATTNILKGWWSLSAMETEGQSACRLESITTPIAMQQVISKKQSAPLKKVGPNFNALLGL